MFYTLVCLPPMRFLFLPLLLACGTDPQTEDSSAAVDPLCEQGYDLNWDNFGHGFMLTYCNSCHSVDSPNRFGAPEGIDFDTEEQLVEMRTRVEFVVIEDETMPLGGGVFDDDLYLFEIYMECGF
jgi:uncharacterized membrane protein